MVAEILVGRATGSMALLADGWHMATHVGALVLSAAAYRLARHLEARGVFAFGSGKLHSLAGFLSALLLALVALSMFKESVERAFSRVDIDFGSSLPVAVLGLVVNLVSVALLHGPGADHAHDHGGACCSHSHGSASDHDLDDPNHRAALVHVLSDCMTSALAIGAILVGRYFGVAWLDPVSGLLGAAVIFAWSAGLLRHAASELVDEETDLDRVRAVRSLLESPTARVDQIRTWSLGQGQRALAVRVRGDLDLDVARATLAPLGFAFVRVEHRPPPEVGRSE